MDKKKELKIATPKEIRPPIPESVKLELWARAGGRCQFRGCNVPIWHDRVTLAVLNLSNIAHIISWKASGPRGDVVKSPQLATNISNLMLTCREHNGLIDNSAYVANYPVPLLLEFKKEHEDRIELVTGIVHTHKTEVLVFKANIGDNAVEIDTKQAQIASLPFYPTKINPFTIDLTTLPTDASDYWASGFDQIERRVQYFFDKSNGIVNAGHVSVFALGPIPFLIKLGKCLGDKIAMKLFQRHRDTQDWCWKNELEVRFTYNINRTRMGEDTKDVGIVLSLSGKIHEEEYSAHLSSNYEIVEVSIEQPNPGFLRQEINLFEFRKIYRDILSEIRNNYGQGVRIHIFAAVPAPVALEIGRGLLPKIDPEVLVYDKNQKISNHFVLIGKI